MRLTKHETRLTKKVFADVQTLEKKQAQIEKETFRKHRNWKM